MRLKGIAQRIIEDMASQGKLTILSKESSENIDHKIAMEFAPYKNEFSRLHSNSRIYALRLDYTKPYDLL